MSNKMTLPPRLSDYTNDEEYFAACEEWSRKNDMVPTRSNYKTQEEYSAAMAEYDRLADLSSGAPGDIEWAD